MFEIFIFNSQTNSIVSALTTYNVSIFCCF